MFDQALSDFAEYVEKQQRLRQPPGHDPSGGASKLKHLAVEEHDELDIIDALDIADSAPRPRLRELLLDTSDSEATTLERLEDILRERIDEGNGETLFELGLEDNGEPMGFTKDECSVAWGRLRSAAKTLSADCKILLSKHAGLGEEVESAGGKDQSATAKVMVRRRPDTVDDVIELRIAVVGNGKLEHALHCCRRGTRGLTLQGASVDAGKSTMLGVLVKGSLDDGRGKARVNLFRHKHEVESGRTSSVGMEIMGFDSCGDVVASNITGRKLSWEEIGKRSVSRFLVLHKIIPCGGPKADAIRSGQSD